MQIQRLSDLAAGFGQGGTVFLSREDSIQLVEVARRVGNKKLTKATMVPENGGFIVPCSLLKELVKQGQSVADDPEEADPNDNPAPDGDGTEATTVETLSNPVKDYAAKDAIQIVNGMESLDQLQLVVDQDSRATVREAAAKRMAALAA